MTAASATAAWLGPRVAALSMGRPARRDERAQRKLVSVRDLLLLKPARYEDRSQIKTVAELEVQERAAFVAEVRRPRGGRPGRGGRTFLCDLVDESGGQLTAVWFHAGPWHKRELESGRRFFFAGDVKPGKHVGRVIFNPEYEEVDDEPEAGGTSVHFGHQVPLYAGVRRARALRRLMGQVLDRVAGEIHDPLPDALRESQKLLPLGQALRELHFPSAAVTPEQLERLDTEAHRRLAFDELLALSLILARRRQGFRTRVGHPLKTDAAAVARAVKALPFKLTGAQTRAVAELVKDLASAHPMQRLLEGDVGSGKTAVAAVGLRLCVESGLKGALMAPTELLAEQHGKSVATLLAPAKIAVHLVTQTSGGVDSAGAQALERGDPCVVVGTHALIQSAVAFRKLGLAVIDEQHRFGVNDRLKLMAKGDNPHVLLMSATPIPRTLALAVHGDLDLSILDELPPGRMPVETKLLVGKTQVQAVEALKGNVAAGQQSYVVYPLVEESEKIDLLDATAGAARLRKALPGARIALVHGQLPSKEREAEMERFRRGEVDVLVATTVVEVGVDVANATLMIIANAERFGLSQLHQLRGRVGRGALKSRCLLLGKSPLSMPARRRLKALEKLNDGFELAELDLELRGAGELLGTRQSGLPELAFADPQRHLKLLTVARDTAFQLVEADPELQGPLGKPISEGLASIFGDRRSLGSVA